MWDNLGRTAGEHPHLSQFNPYQKNSRVEVVGLEICEKCVVAAKEYSDSITDKKFQKHPSTWLNQGCWDDEIIVGTALTKDREIIHNC